MRYFDIHIDSIEEVLEIRKQAKALLSTGATVMSWSNENTSVQKQTIVSIKDVLAETIEFMKLYDPELYGRRITRTLPYYC